MADSSDGESSDKEEKKKVAPARKPKAPATVKAVAKPQTPAKAAKRNSDKLDLESSEISIKASSKRGAGRV